MNRALELRRKILSMKKSRLPNTYDILDYIQSSGTQYIDTGIVATSGFRIQTKLKFTTLPTTLTGIVGAENTTAGTTRNAIYAGNVSNKFCLAAGNTYPSGNTTIALNTEYDLDASTATGSSYIKLSNVSEVTSTDSNTRSAYNIYLFAVHKNGAHKPASIKLYETTITANNTTYTFIPCIRKSDSVVGMYELNTNTFYINSGTGTFRAPYEYLYTQLTYIQATGTQYIETSYKPSDNTKFEVDIQYTALETGVSGIAAGRSNSDRCGVGISSDNGGQFYFGYTTKNIFKGTWDLNRHILGVDFYNNKYYIDTTEYSDSTTYSTTGTATITLLARKDGYGATSKDLYCKAKLYGAKIYTSDTLVKEYVPTKRKSDNVIGVYDIVNGVFYTNAGTGTFTGE